MTKVKLSACKAMCIVAMLSAGRVSVAADTFKTLASFDGTNGMNPGYGPLVQGFDGDFYGTTQQSPVVFRITPNGTLTEVASPTGGIIYAGLTLSADGSFYGTTSSTVFEVTTTGTVTTIHTFQEHQGTAPFDGLIQPANGILYGTAEGGGGGDNGGTVYAVSSEGSFDRLYSFCSQTNCTDGAGPIAVLVKARNGSLYGTTIFGGTSSGCGDRGCGTVFRLDPSTKTLTTLYSFCSQAGCADGTNPNAGLVQAADGSFYGTTSQGGAKGSGTVFRITSNGTFSTLYTFCSQASCADGGVPTAALIQATDSDFYGTTSIGGVGPGTVFKITAKGELTTLHTFCLHVPCDDGVAPYAGLLQATDGNFYGTTFSGGVHGLGTVYRVSVGLGPFVAMLSDCGKVGNTVELLGYNLQGTTAVAFNGTSASFEVVSDTEIKATVPVGATSGYVTVQLASGTLKSNKSFRVLD
ncbi:MAG TPA: choice-of-anchor tandem repeat GloVer-containing protein [Terriglobales bacterium]